ncbi:MAG: nucleotidyltransferase domain-containing protein [archaeon]
MFKNYNKYKLLKVFLFNSTERFRIRELSRKIKLAPYSIMNYLKELEKEGLITVYKKESIPFYQAQRDSIDFKRYQKISIQYELYASGIVDFLWEKMNPEAIILYGGYSKGDAIENSDIDLFLICQEEKIDISAYEKKIGKKIHLLMNSLKKIPKELKKNLVNGIILEGYLSI